MKCCANVSVSTQLQGRSFSPETIAKMSTSAVARGYRGGQDRRWRENTKYRNWRKFVVTRFNNKCAISGRSISVDGGYLVAHHLISAHNCQQLVFEPENGILLASEFHTEFHKRFGYRNNTVEEFQNYLEDKMNEKDVSMPISSQEVSEDTQGSETRVYSLNQVKKLHERLGVVSQILAAKLDVFPLAGFI